ncbi:MAG: glucokinase [Nitrospiraceae bacterium]|nr:MAG: glucokinase [Nitrospiraceae bacterium]
MKKILSADIGGTNSRFAGFQVNADGELALMESIWLRTEDAFSFGHLLENLKAGGFHLKPEDADIAVFAIAGPVENGTKCSPPFISWDVDISSAKDEFGLKWPVLINDFVAQAYACRSVIGEGAEQVKPGRVIRDAAAAVIGAGTALGKAVILPDGKGGYIAIPSEGGHANFAFESNRENEFRQYLLRELGDTYITWNKIVSGSGLSHIHHFLTGERTSPEEVISRILPDTETLDWASRFYGRACRNFALETLAYGGVYIVGGVAARTPLVVTGEMFREEFVRSDTMSDVLSNIPVFLIKEQDSGLWGSASLGLQKLRQSGKL